MNLITSARRLAAAAAITAVGIGTVAPMVAAESSAGERAGIFVDNDSASIIAGSVRVRPCIITGTATVNVEWKYNSLNNTTAARWTAGCVSIIRNGATQARLVAEYRTQANGLIATKVLNCNKGLTANPVFNCPLAVGALDMPFTANLDRVVLKLKTTSPAGPEVSQTVVVGD